MKQWQSEKLTLDGENIYKLYNILMSAQLWIPDEQLRKDAALLRCDIGEKFELMSKEDIAFTRMINTVNKSWGQFKSP